MEIEVGKAYLNRAGHKVEIVREVRGENGFNFIGVIDYGSYESVVTFDKNGKFLFSREPSSCDIISEWKWDQ